MSISFNVEPDVEVEKDNDSIGGMKGVVPSNIYRLEILKAWMEEKKSGALFLNMEFKNLSNSGMYYKENFCVQSGDAKGNKRYYEKNGKKFNLPGYTVAFNICALTTNNKIEDVYANGEEQDVMVYDFASRAEKPIKAHVLTDLIGKVVCLGIKEVIENKRAKGNDGGYYNNNEKVSKNETKHVFQADTMFTVPELLVNTETATKYLDWLKVNKDKVDSKYKVVPAAKMAEHFGTEGQDNQPESEIIW